MDYLELTVDGKVREDKREEYDIPIGLSYDDIVKLRKDEEYGEIFSGLFLFLLILSVLIFLLSVVLFIFLLCNLCCCKRNSSASEGKTKFYLIMTMIFFVCFLVFLILVLVYSRKTVDNMDEINCVAAKFPADLLDGINDIGYVFLGFNPLKSLLQSLSTEIQSVDTL